MRRAPHLRAFVLLEAMLGVAIFAVGVIALGYCVNNCLNAQIFANEDSRARLALANRVAEIQAGAIKLNTPKTEELKGMFSGMTLHMSRRPWAGKNEKRQAIEGIDEILLEARWVSGAEQQSKVVSFYALRAD